ncbi:MAG: 16S rRNA (guanine(527)-N(7))-methyltransferase RsmG [Clostridia bacterium]
MDNLLKNALDPLNITLSSEATARFDVYCRHLIETNKVMNLTAINEPSEIYLRHFADSTALLGCTDFCGKRVIDVGTGAGFPGLPLKIACPDISLTLLDSLNKRISFLSELCKSLGFSDVSCIHGRAEECATEPTLRECFDIAVSRAVSSLPMLCELCLPFLRTGGLFLAMKSLDFEDELSEAACAIETLGGRVSRVWEYSLSDSARASCVIIIEKIAPTPQKYPRRFAKIQKHPL